MVVLKDVFGRERPPIPPRLVVISSESFPSGHALNSMVVLGTFGVAAYALTGRRWPLVAALAGSLAIGLSRVYLAAHWLLDVLAGWVIGAVVAAAGLLVLLSAMIGTRDERAREVALLRTLGARRSVIRAGLLAEYRQLPALTGLHKVELADGTLQGTREDARGTWELEAPLPAIVTVNDKSDKPRFPNFKGLMAAKKAEITTFTLAELGIEAIAPTTSVVAAEKRPPRTAGEIVTDEDGSGATALVDFLASKKFI